MLSLWPGLIAVAVPAGAQVPSVIVRMAGNEVAARQQELRFSYLAEEVSSRTGGHRWREKVVETDDGPLRRLLAVDGKLLSPEQARAESDRIDALVRDPEAFRQANLARKDDETKATQLLTLLPKAFLFTPAGVQDGCTRFSFRPDPAYEPSSYEERVAHAMGGTVSVREPMDRLCTLDATILTPVEFGFGLLGRVEQGGHFSLERVLVDGTHWKTDRVVVHVEGRVLMLKTLTRNQDIRRAEIVIVPQHLSLKKAARLTIP